MASQLRKVFGSGRTKSSASASSHGRVRSEEDQTNSSTSNPSSPAQSLGKASSKIFGRSDRGPSPSPAPSSPLPPTASSKNTAAATSTTTPIIKSYKIHDYFLLFNHHKNIPIAKGMKIAIIVFSYRLELIMLHRQLKYMVNIFQKDYQYLIHEA